MGSPSSEVSDKNIIPLIHKIDFDFVCLEPFLFGFDSDQHSFFFDYAIGFSVFANVGVHFSDDETVLRF
jgi:hypothetical protein